MPKEQDISLPSAKLVLRRAGSSFGHALPAYVLEGRSWRSIATVPRILATILNESVVAGMFVLPRPDLGQRAKYLLGADVFRFAPKNRHRATASACPLRANKRLMHCSKKLPIRPRSLSTSAIEARLVVPATWIARITGSTVWANSFAALIWIARPRGPARLRL